MTDADDHDHDHDDEHVHEFIGISIGQLLGQHDHEREQLRNRHRVMGIENFLDSLSAEQLLGLRSILTLDRDSESNCFFDGQVVTLLRIVHHVDPSTGDSLDPQMLAGADD